MAKMLPPSNRLQVKHSSKYITNNSHSVIEKESITGQDPPSSIKPIQLKIPEDKKNEFKAYAAMRGRSMNALFLDMFEEYKEKHA